MKSESDSSESNPYRPPTGNELPVEVVQNLRVPGPVTIIVAVGLAVLGGGAGFFFTCLGIVSVNLRGGPSPAPTLPLIGCAVVGLLAYTVVAKASLSVFAVTHSAKTVQLSWFWLLLNAVLTLIVTALATVIFTFFGGLIIGPAFGSWILYAMHRRQANAARGTTNTQPQDRPWSH